MKEGDKSRFSYETRITSRDFCNALLNNEIVVPSSAESKLSDVIKDAPWFFISWEKDPTVKSMLIMLDAIHQKFFEGIHFYELISNPINPLVSFQFIELKDFGLSDSLYIKMNARGKELTEFENFKAKIEQLLEASDKEHGTKYKDIFSLNMDTIWTEIFWKYRDAKTCLFDEKIMNFVRVLATNDFALKPSNETSVALGKLLSRQDLGFYDFEDFGCFDEPFIPELIETLNNLYTKGVIGVKEYLPGNLLINESELFRKATENALTYPEQIQFFAIYKYINKYQDDKLIEWFRVIRNLTENTRIEEISVFVTIIKSVSKILDYGNTILTYISDQSNEIKGFAVVQVEEERIKASLILKSDEWKQAITKIENHGYFKGQIGFILKFSGITDSFREKGNLEWYRRKSKLLNRFSDIRKRLPQYSILLV